MAGSVDDAYNSDDGAAKAWEGPLTAEEMRLHACKWTLADDSQLLAYLEELSDSIVTRMRGVQKDLGNLIHETWMSSVKVSNVINDFNLLSTLQFIENRVYDEDVKQEGNMTRNKVCAVTTKEEQEAALVARITQACQLGIDVVRSALEHLNLETEGDSDDSEDESGGHESTHVPPLLRLRDPYLDRPLPHLIGSEAFVEDDYVGLGDLLGEEDEKSSRAEYESTKSDSEVESEEEGKVLLAGNHVVLTLQEEFGRASEEESEEEEMFGEKEPVPGKVSKVTASNTEVGSEGDTFVASENASLHKQGSVTSKSAVEPGARTAEGAACLFEEPLEDSSSDWETLSHNEVKEGTLSGPGKLFDDNDEGILIGTETKVAVMLVPSTGTPKLTEYTKSGRKIAVGTASILGVTSNTTTNEREESRPSLSPISVNAEVGDNIFDAKVVTRKVLPPQTAATVTVSKMFTADDGEEDDLWLTGTSKTASDWTTLPAIRDERKHLVPTTAGLFDDGDDDLFTSRKPSTKGLFLSDDEDCSKEGTKMRRVTSDAVPGAGKTSASVVGREEKHPISLFDDEEAEDDLFLSGTPRIQMTNSQNSDSTQGVTWSSEALQHPKMPTKEASVSFDEAVDWRTTLVNVTKDRAKIQTKRRLPSRRRQQRCISSEPDNADSTLSRKQTPVTPSAMSSATEASLMKSPSTEEEDLFSVVEDSLKPPPVPSSALKSSNTSGMQVNTLSVVGCMARMETVAFESVFDAKQEADDLFTLPSKRTASPSVSGRDSAAMSDALFGSGNNASEGKSGARPASLPFRDSSKEADLITEMAAIKSDVFDVGYDIFSSPGKPQSRSSKQATLFDDDADDIFAPAPRLERMADILEKPSPAVKHTSQSTTLKDPLLHGSANNK